MSDKRSSFPCPAVRSDVMRPVRSMADGKLYDSASAYKRGLERTGWRVKEAGEDRAIQERQRKEWE